MDKMIISNDIPPLGKNGMPKRKFEVKMKIMGSDPRKDGLERAVFIDGVKLDFSIDILRFLEAKNKGVDYLVREKKRIEKEFLKAVSDALGRRVSPEELKMAILEGWI